MPLDSYTEVTTESYVDRLGSAFKGIAFGFLLFIIAFPLLFWNEGRAVKRYQTLEEGEGAVISVIADTINPQHEGELIHVTGLATTEETLEDPVFGVAAPGLQLIRNVSMYQWREKKESTTKKNVSGSTTTETIYTYTKTWSEATLDSSRFRHQAGHENPDSMAYQSQRFVAQAASLGAFRLPPHLLEKIDNSQALPINMDTLPPHLRAQPFGGGFYLGQNPSAPQIGDIKITFQKVPPTKISLIAKQVNDSFAPYSTQAGGDLLLLKTGRYSADEMFQQEQRANALLTWLLRGVGFFIMALGLSLVLKPLSVFADVLPFLGNLVGTMTGIVSAILAAVCSLTTIAIAWLFYRPALGLCLLGVAAACLIGFKWLSRQAANEVTPSLPSEAMAPPSQISQN
jgi:hypothetical protein